MKAFKVFVGFIGVTLIMGLVLFLPGVDESFQAGFASVQRPTFSLPTITLYTIVFVTWYSALSLFQYLAYRIMRSIILHKQSTEHNLAGVPVSPEDAELEEELEKTDE